MAKFRGRWVEVRRVWTVIRNRRGDEFEDFFETKDEALRYVEDLAETDRRTVERVHETGAIELDGELIAFVPSCEMEDTGFAMASGADFVGAEYAGDEELAEIIKNGISID